MFRAERTTILVIVLAMCALTAFGLLMGYPRQAILFPIVACVCAIVFAAMRFIEIARAERAAAGGADPDELAALRDDAGSLELRAAARPFAWVFGALLFIWLLGYLAGLTVYVFAFLIAHRISFRTTLAVTAGTALGIYLIFAQILKVLLPVGFLGDALGF